MSNNDNKAIIRYNRSSDENNQEIEGLKQDDGKIMSAIKTIKEVIKTSKTYDLLKYRYKDNGLILFVYGPKNENEDRVIERLETVIKKYKEKRGTRPVQKVQVESFIRKLLR